MSRIRTIKPEAFLDEELWDAEQETTLPLFRAFSGLWCQADREGRFEWRPRQLKAAILPYWDGDFSRVLDALATRGFLVLYTSQGREYGWIPTFRKHQFINNKEPASVLPAPPVSSVNPKPSRVFDASSSRASREADAPIPSPSPPFPSDPLPEGVQGEAAPDDRETPCPLDLAERCDLAGVPEQFAKTHGVSTEAVRAQIRETVAYWTVGPGTGRRKKQWLRVVRNRLHELAKQGLLVKPTGFSAADPEALRRRREAANQRALEARERDVRQELERRGIGPVTLAEATAEVAKLVGDA